MKKLFTLSVLLVLTCLLGNGALAQNRGVMKQVTETIDFTVTKQSGNPGVTFGFNSNKNPMINNQVVSERITVDNTGYWGFWGSDAYHESYLQKNTNSNTSYVYLSGLNVDDIVTIWGEVGNNQGSIPGAYNITSGATLLNTTYFEYNGDNLPDSKQYRITEAGTATIQVDGNYSGIRKITIQYQERATNYFNYDPGYEEYDMYDEGTSAHPTSYTTTGAAGFTLNGNAAQYITLSGTGLTINDRIAVDPSAGTWNFNYGIISPNNDGTWSNLSICDLKEGDRVVFSFTGYDNEDNIRFSSKGGSDPFTDPEYNGCKAFFDKYNDGIFDEGEDTYITPGAQPVIDWSRGEGTILRADNRDDNGDNYLHYTQTIVITEDGHLDLAIKNAVGSRIVKIKIYSDHQASMVDEYDAVSYTSKFDITGELQAKEHIVPGGLEVHVGDDDASQHAHVVRSGNGPVSIVNGVDGFKLPGMSRSSETGNLVFNFNLGKTNQQGNYDSGSIPTTGTFYKFMPLEKGKMTIKFQAASMNYYRYDLNGDAVYYNDQGYYNNNNAWSVEFDRPNEQTVSGTCPYYLMKTTDGVNFTLVETKNVENGRYDSFVVENALAGETYYLFGGWNASGLYFNNPGSGGNNLEYFTWGTNTNMSKACGVAKLLEIQYNPDKKIYPLAKWVPNATLAVKDDNGEKIGVPNPDTFTMEYELADIYGYTAATKITVKKMAGNITKCHPFLKRVSGGTGHEDHFKLMIDGIDYADGKDKGGTILIKIGEPSVRSNPVYTLTIAYSTNPTFDGNSGNGTRGHIWDYSSNSLHGFDWEPGAADAPKPDNQGVFTNDLTENSKYAQPADYGHYFTNYLEADISSYSSVNEVLSSDQNSLQPSGSGLLYDEIHEEESHSITSDWKFSYNLVNAGNLYDPVFLNKYDTEGDNADLIWETEGTILKTSANQSCIFNEFVGTDIHQSEKDPDRHVGILQGGEFRIPWLMPNDRVIVYMGVGKGAFNDQAVFNIRGAYDAVHNEISESDDYIVGGSHWDGADGDKNYRGCYHFFAQGHNGGPADMVFKMTGGSMCKIYSIQIYRGDRIVTNEVVGATDNDNKFLLWSKAADPNDESSEDDIDENQYNWTLKYFGKEQKLADGTNSVDNEIIAQTGIVNQELTTSTETDPTEDTYNTFTYQHQAGEIGTFRMRGKDMEKGMNYVADYADHNVTIAYQQTQTYPYTWDFTDVTGIEANITNLFDPEEKLGEGDSAPAGSGLTDEVWGSLDAESYQKTARDLSLWEVYGTSGNYFLRLNSQTSQTPQNLMERDNIFETAKEIGGNQVWANGTVVPEMQGLWFYTENNNQGNGEWIIKQGDDQNVGGLEFAGTSPWFKKIVVPNVPKDAAVYLRMTKITDDSVEPEVRYMFGQQESMSSIKTSATSPTGTGTETFYEVGDTGDYIVALMNTNSNKSNLTLSLNGYRIQKLAVSTDFKSILKVGWGSESRDHVIDPELTSFMTGKDFKTYIVSGASYADKKVTLKEVNAKSYVIPAAEEQGDENATILRNMTKDENNTSLENPYQVRILNSGFHLFVPDMNDYIASREDGRTNQKRLQDMSSNVLKSFAGAGTITQDGTNNIFNYVLTTRTQDVNSGAITEYENVQFARVPKKNGLTTTGNQAYLPVDCSVSGDGSAKLQIVFEPMDEEPVEPIADGVEMTVEEQPGNSDAVYYNLNGQKIDGRPTKGGIYVVNGKKVVFK